MTDLTALTEITTPTTDDLVYVVDAPAGAKNPRKCSIANLVDARTKTLTNTTIDADGIGNSITNIENADIKSSAGIDLSKLAVDPLARANHTGTQVHTTISDFDTGVQANRLDQMAAPSADVALGSQKITGLANGVSSTDAATKGQLDTAVASDITLKGSYNANINSPNLDSSPTAGTIDQGDHYVVSVAGTFYTESLQEGDSLISEVDNPSALTDWIITNNNVVTPIVTANIADEAVTEGKLYISNAGNNGEFLSKQSNNNGGLTWATVPAGYNAPTIGSTSIGSGATVTTIAGLTLSSPAITTSQTFVDNSKSIYGSTGTKKLNIYHDGSNSYIQGAGSAGYMLYYAPTASDLHRFLVNNTTVLDINNNGLDVEGDIRLQDAAGTEYVGIEAPTTVTGSYILKLPPATGATGEVLKMSSTANSLEWGTGGGGATIVHAFSNTTNTSYTGTASSFGTVGVDDRDIYIKKIDANNEGVFTKIWKNGAAVEVQIA